MALTKASDRDRCSTGQGMPGCGNETWEIPLGDRRGASLLILTGCRLTEIMMLKWSYVDLPTATLNLPDSKTGAKVVHIGKPEVGVLRRIAPLPGNPWVITGKLSGSRLSDLQPFWQRVRARAGLKDARIHELAPHVCLGCRRRRPGPADNWQAAR